MSSLLIIIGVTLLISNKGVNAAPSNFTTSPNDENGNQHNDPLSITANILVRDSVDQNSDSLSTTANILVRDSTKSTTVHSVGTTTRKPNIKNKNDTSIKIDVLENMLRKLMANYKNVVVNIVMVDDKKHTAEENFPTSMRRVIVNKQPIYVSENTRQGRNYASYNSFNERDYPPPIEEKIEWSQPEYFEPVRYNSYEDTNDNGYNNSPWRGIVYSKK